MSIVRETSKEDIVHVYNGMLLSHVMNKIIPFAATWTDLEINIILSESQQVFYMYSMILYCVFIHLSIFVYGL